MTSDLTGQGPANTADEGRLPPKEASADKSASIAGFQPVAETAPAQIAVLKAEVSVTELHLHNQLQGLRLNRI